MQQEKVNWASSLFVQPAPVKLSKYFQNKAVPPTPRGDNSLKKRAMRLQPGERFDTECTASYFNKLQMFTPFRLKRIEKDGKIVAIRRELENTNVTDGA